MNFERHVIWTSVTRAIQLSSITGYQVAITNYQVSQVIKYYRLISPRQTSLRFFLL